ncbi:hypothetical protein BaRGS_00023207, partial [Batillaria attramentaria]
PAQVTSVSVQHAHGTWKATGSCDVTKVFSFLSRYSCQWYRGTSQVLTVVKLKNDDIDYLSSNTSVPYVTSRDFHDDIAKRALTLAMLAEQYPEESWIHVYTDWSATNVVANGGVGIYIKFPDGDTSTSGIPTGKHCSNYMAEVQALIQVTTMIQTSQSDLLSSTSYNTSDITGDTNYRRGTCSFTADIPPTSGTYYYRVVVHPGGTENVSGPVTVDEPSTPTITSCSPDLWAPIGSQLMCTCNTNDIGQPTGRLQWVRDGSVVKSGNYGDNSLSTTQVNLTQGDDGSQFTCRVEWIQDKQSATHTVRVAWGPNNMSIPPSRRFDTDSSGSRDLSLSCNATDVNPSMNLTYSWTGRCQGNTGSTCRLQPKPSGDDGMVVGCTVTNPYNNNQQRQGSYTLDLKCKSVSLD